MSEAALGTAIRQMLVVAPPAEPDWADVVARAWRSDDRTRRLPARRGNGHRRLAWGFAIALAALLVAGTTPVGTSIAHALSVLLGESPPQEYRQLRQRPFPRARLPLGVTMSATATAPRGDGHWDVGWNLYGGQMNHGVLDYFLIANHAKARAEWQRVLLVDQRGGPLVHTGWRLPYPSWTVGGAFHGRAARLRCGSGATTCFHLFTDVLVGDVQVSVISGFTRTNPMRTQRQVVELALAFLRTATARKG